MVADKARREIRKEKLVKLQMINLNSGAECLQFGVYFDGESNINDYK